MAKADALFWSISDVSGVDSLIPCQQKHKSVRTHDREHDKDWHLVSAVSLKITSKSVGSAVGGTSWTGSGLGSGSGSWAGGRGGGNVDGSSTSDFLLYSMASTA